MCLCTKQICPLRARKDIVCYKQFEFPSVRIGGTMRTAIIGIVVNIPKPNEPTIMVAYPEDRIEKFRIIDTKARFRIYGGMIHAFTNLEICNKRSWTIVVFKCVIPKGTLYYKGTSGDICAKKMLVVEQVK